MSAADKKPQTKGPAHDEWIDKSIREARKEQFGHEQTDKGTEYAQKCRNNQVMNWTSANVVDWLTFKNLHQFISMFKKHHVTGKDLVNLTLPFLESYQQVSLDERELLLSEIYKLLNPATICASDEDLTKIKSQADRQKYLAAVELAKGQGLIPRSSSVLVLPTQGSPRTLPNLMSPKIKPRHKSESGMDSGAKVLPKFEEKLFDAKKRKTGPKITSGIKTMHEALKTVGPHCIQCIELSAADQSEISMAISPEGHVTIEAVPRSLCDRLHPGVRVLEINGQILQSNMKDGKTTLEAVLNSSSPANLVVLTEQVTKGMGSFPDEKWDRLHSMLVDMREAENLPLDIPSLPSDQEEYLRHTNILQEEIKRLEEKVRELQKTKDSMQVELEDKDAVMHDLQVSRDKAIEKLKQTRMRVRQKNTRENLGGTEYFNLTMDSLNLQEASKEDVENSLKEIVKEASKQKWYLDRLISLVIEEVPWLLDEVDSEFDNLALTDQIEEFC